MGGGAECPAACACCTAPFPCTRTRTRTRMHQPRPNTPTPTGAEAAHEPGQRGDELRTGVAAHEDGGAVARVGGDGAQEHGQGQALGRLALVVLHDLRHPAREVEHAGAVGQHRARSAAAAGGGRVGGEEGWVVRWEWSQGVGGLPPATVQSCGACHAIGGLGRSNVLHRPSLTRSSRADAPPRRRCQTTAAARHRCHH